MKKILSFFLTYALLAFVSPAAAQPPGPGGRMIERLAEELNLNDEQVESIEALFEASFQSCSNGISRKEHRQCMMSSKDDIHAEIKELLTDEQLVRFEEIESLREEVGPRGLRLLSRLKQIEGVSEEQIASVKEVLQSVYEACGSSDFGSDRRECMRSKRDTMRSVLEEVLSEEQLEAVRPNRRYGKSRRFSQ